MMMKKEKIKRESTNNKNKNDDKTDTAPSTITFLIGFS
tara:strand:- start:3984 stop:4097 length:114 start_codon:yes stop_codon:yes gene_type:complete